MNRGFRELGRGRNTRSRSTLGGGGWVTTGSCLSSLLQADAGGGGWVVLPLAACAAGQWPSASTPKVWFRCCVFCARAVFFVFFGFCGSVCRGCHCPSVSLTVLLPWEGFREGPPHYHTHTVSAFIFPCLSLCFSLGRGSGRSRHSPFCVSHVLLPWEGFCEGPSLYLLSLCFSLGRGSVVSDIGLSTWRIMR